MPARPKCLGRRWTAAVAAVVAAFSVCAMPPTAAAAWTWPVRGEVVTGHVDAGGPYAAGQHRGIDVAAAAGTPVVAAAGGRVRFAGLVGSSGLTVSMRTADGRFDTSYLHLAAATVRAGQTVGAGERIGAVGTSGLRSAIAPHLHFGVRDAGARRYRDPLDLLPSPPGIRDAPRGTPVAVRGPVRIGPAPEPVRPHRFPVLDRAPLPVGASRAGWVIACGALILAVALARGGVHGRRRVRTVARRLLPSFGGR